MLNQFKRPRKSTINQNAKREMQTLIDKRILQLNTASNTEFVTGYSVWKK